MSDNQGSNDISTLSYDDRRRMFLAGLADLTKKFRVSIGGCGCCGSPWVDDVTEKDIDSHVYNVSEESGNGLEFGPPWT